MQVLVVLLLCLAAALPSVNPAASGGGETEQQQQQQRQIGGRGGVASAGAAADGARVLPPSAALLSAQRSHTPGPGSMHDDDVHEAAGRGGADQQGHRQRRCHGSSCSPGPSSQLRLGKEHHAPTARALQRHASASSSPPPVTLVLVTHFKDLARSLAAIASVKLHMPSSLAKELLLIVPAAEYLVLRQTLASSASDHARPWPIRVLPEYELLNMTRSNFTAKVHNIVKYKLQMALKLAVAAVVTTPWYLTLDSDVVMVRRPPDERWFFPEPGEGSSEG